TTVFIEQKPKNDAQRSSAPPPSTGPADDLLDAQPSAETTSQGSADCLDSDLPDIVDLVLEMGNTREAPADAPSPLPAAANLRLPAHLQELAGRARDYVEAASSPNTRRA